MPEESVAKQGKDNKWEQPHRSEGLEHVLDEALPQCKMVQRSKDRSYRYSRKNSHRTSKGRQQN